MEVESTDCSLLNEMFQKVFKDSQDEFAVSMFSTIIKNNTLLVQKAIDLILEKIKLDDVPQSLRAIELLEECMSKSGPEFQLQISKYRFLNELSKLVSKKYLGDKTHKDVKNKIMDCFLLWTAQYPDKDKIKSVYDCLKKEGVQDTCSSSSLSLSYSYPKRSNIVDEENERKLKKLLQSTNKEDVKKANVLIQYLVKQDEKKIERVLKQKAELKEIENTTILFNQVIDSFMEDYPVDDDDSSSLLEELYEACIKYKNIVTKMPNIMEDSEEDLFRETIAINDKLLEVIEKYNNLKCLINSKLDKPLLNAENLTSSTIKDTINSQLDDLLSGVIGEPKTSEPVSVQNPLDDLAEIFSINSKSDCLTPALAEKQTPIKEEKLFETHATSPTKLPKKDPFLTTIDDLSADLFKQSLSNLESKRSFIKEDTKMTLNELSKLKQKINTESNDLEKIDSLKNVTDKEENIIKNEIFEKEIIDTSSTNENILSLKVENISTVVNDNQNSNSKPKINYLSDVNIDLDDIEPSNLEPIILQDLKDGLKVILNFAINKPFENTSVVVVSTINQGQLPIDDFQFDAFVKKPCKLRLLERNGNYLPGVKPFRPPSDCLQQIMLVYNPTEKPIEITYTFSYKEGEDPDPIKESLITSIPYIK